jgi:hypothetical protein
MIGRLAHSLRASVAGVAAVEFALSMPLILLLTTLGIEYTNYVVTRKRISEIAAMLADNASRMGDQAALSNKPVSEQEINDILQGAASQGGQRINIQRDGRILLSSLERNPDGGQWIHWQRCFGAQAHVSTFGTEGEGATGAGLAGMGPTGGKVMADVKSAVMVVEISYRYAPIIGIIPLNLQNIVEYASFRVRDSRDLTQVYPVAGVVASTCG